MTDPAVARPLSGLRVVEFAGLGPVPFAATILADMGADVVRIDRPGGVVRPGGQANDFTQSSRRAVAIDLSESSGVARALALIERADVVVEGFRPGVVERLGVGPQECRHRNAALVYGRMTGWGQSGPLASRAGHDINYLAVTGALHAIGTAERPTVPLNLVADYGGGAMFLVAGVLAARLRAVATGVGDVVDAAMVDGVIALTGVVQGMRSSGLWADGRESNVVDGGLPWYSVYETADGHWMSVGALEPQFFREFCRLLPLDATEAHRDDPSCWPAMRAEIAAQFRRSGRARWCAVFDGTEACVTPVLTLDEATRNAHLRARGAFVQRDGIVQPAPAPRFAGSSPAGARPASTGVTDLDVLATWPARDLFEVAPRES